MGSAYRVSVRDTRGGSYKVLRRVTNEASGRLPENTHCYCNRLRLAEASASTSH